jgi:hypothetical protein
VSRILRSCLDLPEILADVAQAARDGLPDTEQRILNRWHLAKCPNCHQESARLHADGPAWSPWLGPYPLALAKQGKLSFETLQAANPGREEEQLRAALDMLPLDEEDESYEGTAEKPQVTAADIVAGAERDLMCVSWLPRIQNGLKIGSAPGQVAEPSHAERTDVRLEELSLKLEGVTTLLESLRREGPERRPAAPPGRDWFQLALIAACVFLLVNGSFQRPTPSPTPSPSGSPAGIGVHAGVPVSAWTKLQQAAEDAARAENDPARKQDLEGLARFAAELRRDPSETVGEWAKRIKEGGYPEDLSDALADVERRLKLDEGK